MEENKNALDEVNKGCTMGAYAINELIEKVDNKSFKQALKEQLKEYDKVEDKIQAIYSKYSDSKPHEIGVMSKVMTNSMMNMKTMTDHTDSKIAEILLQGINIGIIEGRKILNNKKLNQDVKSLIEYFIKTQENMINEFKKYL